MIVGARVIKTGIAVTISMYICYLLNIQPAIFAGAATVVNLQPSVIQSLKNAKEQVFVHFFAIGIAIAFGLTLGPHEITMGISAIVIITLLNKMGIKQGIVMGVVASIFILDSPTTQFLDHALIRSLAIIIGLATAIVVNFTIAPPHYKKTLVEKIRGTNQEIWVSFSTAVTSYSDLSIPSHHEWLEKKESLMASLEEAEDLYSQYRHEIGYNDGDIKHPKRKTVLFYKEFLAYNKGLLQRASDINFLAHERLKRRKETGNLTVSPQFQEILNLLQEGLSSFDFYNEHLNNKLDNGLVEVFQPPQIWNKIDNLLNSWHDRFPSGSHYLHALIEVSLITYKMSWATNESIKLLEKEL